MEEVLLLKARAAILNLSIYYRTDGIELQEREYYQEANELFAHCDKITELDKYLALLLENIESTIK